MLRRLILLCCIVLLASAVQAQNSAASLPIAYGQQVTGTISEQAFFDHYELPAKAHDRIYTRMTATGGLRPLIGILNDTGTLLARSANGDADSTVDLTFDVPQDGTYTLVATRVDNQFGTTTGDYTLRVDNLNPPATRDPRFQDVTFPCGGAEAMAAASVHFSRDDTDNGAYSLRVYGFDNFQPVIRVQSGDGAQDVCITDPADALGDVVTLPGERPVTITASSLSQTAQYVITSENTPDPSSITVTIGSYHQLPGRYLAVIGGFAIEPSTDLDNIEVRLAPFPAHNGRAPMLLYMIGVNNRLDPSILTETGRCDDAGRRGCEDVPSAVNVGVILNNGVHVTGDRFDAGAKISDADPHALQLISFSGTTHGEYALVLTGSLPPLD